MVFISSSERTKLHSDLEGFLDASSTQQDEVDMLLKYLQHKPRAIMQDILSADEVRERLEFARQTDQKRRGGQLTAIEFSIIMAVPLNSLRNHDALRKFGDRTFADDFGAAFPFSEIQSFVRIFLQKAKAEYKPLRTPSCPSTASTLTKSSKRKSLHDSDLEYAPKQDRVVRKGKLKQNEKEAQKVLRRDKSACVLLGTANPEVCHIIPFAMNSTRDSLDRIARLEGINYIHPQIRLLYEYLGCSNKEWNMISLNSQLHKWWGEAYFALKCLGITPDISLQGEKAATIQLQFHWMQRQQHNSKSMAKPWEKKIYLDEGDGEKMVEKWKTDRYGRPSVLEPGGIICASNAATSRPLQSGQVFEITMTEDDDMTAWEKAERMKVMIDIQWATIQIATMSGAAGSPEFLINPDEDEDNAFQLWHEERCGRYYRHCEMSPAEDSAESE